MRIVVIGSNGQVGSDVISAARGAGLSTVGLERKDCDVTDAASVSRALASLEKADVVVNTAAFHRTDACEENPDRALSVNAVGAYRVSAASHRHKAAVVYISSDFVFDGTKRSPYVESDMPNPLNVYGMTKYAGELLVRIANPKHYIVRISSVFGIAGSSGKGGNFVEAMVARARAGERPSVVDDIVMAPTSARDAARRLVELLVARAPFGTYHLADAGQCSWFEFANAIFQACGSDLSASAISSAESAGKAQRPKYSVLASEKLGALGISPRRWQVTLTDYLVRKGHRTEHA